MHTGCRAVTLFRFLMPTPDLFDGPRCNLVDVTLDPKFSSSSATLLDQASFPRPAPKYAHRSTTPIISGARTDGTFLSAPFPHQRGTVAWFFPRLSLMEMPAGGGAALLQELDEKSSTRSANASHVPFLFSKKQVKPQPRVTQASFPLPFSRAFPHTPPARAVNI